MRHWLCLILGLLLAGPIAATTTILDGNAAKIGLSDALSHRADPSGQLDITEIAAHPEAFHAVSGDGLHRGFSRDAHWLQIELVNPERAPLTRWLEIGNPRLESIQLFWRDGDTWKELAAGTQVPRAEKAVVAAVQLLPLTIAPGEARELFIRISSRSMVDLNASAWEPLAFRTQEAPYFLKQGAFLASLLLAASFSLLIYLRMRDHVYLLFSCALFFQIVNQASTAGILQRFLWPAAWPFATEIIASCWGLAVCFHMLVLRDFLDIRRTLASWNWGVTGLAGVAGFSGLAVLIFDYQLWIQVIRADTLACVVLAPLLSLILLRRGFRPARFMVAGTSVLWLAVLLTMATSQNWFPIWAVTFDSLPLAAVIASSLILFAVTERTYELRQALARADAAVEAKTTFLAHMSHDLRTPLNTVIGFARLIRRGAPHISPRESGSAIEQSGLHLLAMIDDLLDHTRADLGRLQLDPLATPWADFIKRISEAAGAMTEAAGNRFILETKGGVPAVLMLDSRRLRQVLENLLTNANRHTRNGNLTLLCQFEAADSPGNAHLRFRLTDTGEGIAPEDQERIFEPFQRGTQYPTEKNKQGSGLGLAISRQLVRLMGGELSLEHSSPSGSCFGFDIKCVALENANALPATDDPAGTRHIDRARTVLVVEDLVEQRRLLCYQLETAGFSVVEAASGHEALACLDDHIDLVLTDQFMSDGDGWDVLQSVRARFRNLPVLLLSAADPKRPPAFPSNLDFDAILAKPLDETQLFRCLEELLAIEWLDTGVAPTVTSAVMLVPPARYRAELAQLTEQGRVTDIDEWADCLLTQSADWGHYANVVKQALRHMDFEELARLAAEPSTTE